MEMAPIDFLNAEKMTAVLEDRHSVQYWDVITQSACMGTSVVCLAMRLYSRVFLSRSPGCEDYTCFLAWVGLVGYGVLSIKADQHGSGAHRWDISDSDLEVYSKLAYASQIVYAPLIFVTKLSILLLYLRVFAPAVKTKTFAFTQFLIWGNFLYYLVTTMVKIFQCTPREKVWDKDTKGHCLQIEIPIVIASAINVVSDFAILLLPLVLVWRLQVMRRSTKLGLSAIFLAGSFGCISSVVRLVVSIQTLGTEDKTYDWFPEFLWTTAEITSGIIASCLPAFPTFFQHLFQKAATVFSRVARYRSTRKRAEGKLHPRSRATDLTSNWEQEPGIEIPGKSCLASTVKTEVSSQTRNPAGVDGHRGIMKTVEVEVASERVEL